MADIAMLVAEEYERRVKNSRKAGEAGHMVEVNWVSYASSMAQSIKDKIGHENLGAARLILEPKSPISLAAIDGFFSA